MAPKSATIYSRRGAAKELSASSPPHAGDEARGPRSSAPDLEQTFQTRMRPRLRSRACSTRSGRPAR
eukprot:4001621-Pyramimonas_sp.AAC.1